jgi:type IV pilus assembly protein PilO
MNKLIERVVKLPVGTKLAVVVLAVLAVTGLNYFMAIGALEKQIDNNVAMLKKLDDDLIEKKVIADNLNQFRRDREILERRLAEALTELPASRDIDELLRQLNDVGKKSGLEIVSLEPGRETPHTFYASIPIKMQVAGSYHEIAVFFESVSKLRRIVNVTNLSFGSPERKNEKVVLKATYLATTFRFIEAKESASKQPQKKKK